ncbi:hypothetical protein TruAng_001835 [Truncatella angustata]|nr:hypothetical protein TruAng_001835 [Truncatella angustata]
MAEQSKFESLPNEILLEILSFLSQRLLRVCRDSVFWRLRCHEESTFLESFKRRRSLRFSDEDETLVSAVLSSQNGGPDTTNTPRTSRKAVENERVRILANWDPSFDGESVNWYNEYIQRRGAIAVSWFEQPQIRDGDMKDAIEVKGTALFRPSQNTDVLYAVAPLDDGSVCLWDVKGNGETRRKPGSILSKSQEGLLRLDSPSLSFRSRMTSIGITECVSVDSSRNRAFFAVQSHLVEVDLQTLQIVAQQPYEWPITTMSTAHPTIPLTIGTFHGIHLHDSRVGTKIKRDRNERLDVFDRVKSPDLSLVMDPSPLPPYAPLTQSGPLSILHMEQPSSKELISDDIFVAGRFASVLHYDRRMFPAIKGSIHSGARLCSLASLPYPFSCLDSDLRRHGELSVDQVNKVKSATGGRTLIAGGEYNTKGSLEIYGLAEDQGNDDYNLIQKSTMKNRQTASAAKLLSVINHGARIVYSDGDGYLKWMERDGFTEVRRHKIGHGEKVAHRSLFASMPGSDEIARKMLSTRTKEMGTNGDVNNDDIVFWTGEKLGLVSFSSQPGFSSEDFEDDTRTPEEIKTEKEAHLYNERMRLALERQANDVRYVRHLGAGILRGI